MDYLYLASRSPRRRALLQQIGLPHRLLDVDINESVVNGEAATAYVERLAQMKAETASAMLAASSQDIAPVLAADTTVVQGGQIIGKPATPAEAVEILLYLRGKEHLVHTGVAIVFENQRQSLVVTTRVRLAPLSRDCVERYVATGESMDKAGAYGIQGYGGVFVESIEGSYSSVVGLPVRETAALAAGFGIHCWQSHSPEHKCHPEDGSSHGRSQ